MSLEDYGTRLDIIRESLTMGNEGRKGKELLAEEIRDPLSTADDHDEQAYSEQVS